MERRNVDTRIEICCAAKPGLLLSTVTTLEALGLDIQHCVISCFNDFGMQASCSEVLISSMPLLFPENIFFNRQPLVIKNNIHLDIERQNYFTSYSETSRC